MQLKSMSFKIIVLVILTIIVVMGFEGMGEYFTKEAELNKDMAQKLKALPNNISISVSMHFWNYDKKSIREFFLHTMNDREVFGIRLLESTGDTYLGMKKDIHGNIVEDEVEKQDIDKHLLISAKADLKNEEQVIGQVEVFLTKVVLQASIRKIIINTILKIVLIAIISALLLIFFLERILLVQIRLLSSKFKEISEGAGDLTFQIEARTEDELGLCARYFNTFIKNLSLLIKSIKITVVENKQLGEDLFIDTDQVATGISEISAIMNSMNQKIVHLNLELSKTKEAVTKVDSFVKKAVMMIDEQSSSVAESSSAVEEMIANINNLVTVTESKKNLALELTSAAEEGDANLKNTVASINEITQSAEFMFEIIAVINNISRQTNLLAMNAAIEAAHAGEFGKGFSVVAEEIRKLAETSANNTKSMSKSLKAIIEKIKNTAIVSNKVNVSVSQLIHGTRQIAEAMTEMLTGLKEINIGSEQMTVSLSHLIHLTEEVRGSSQDLDINFSSINESIKVVYELGEDNKKSLAEAAIGVNEIGQSIQSLRDLSDKNSHNLIVLDESVSKFKTE